MDLFLEDPRVWTEFQQALIGSLSEFLLPISKPESRYEVQIGERRYRVEESQPESNPTGEQHEQFIEIRNRSDDRLITLIEVVSLANKRTANGREAYLTTRKEAIAEKASTVEIDLLIQGQPTLTYSREGLPEFDYSVSVTRTTQSDRYEIYTSMIQKRLPKFKLPLASDDRDALLDLQTIFTQAYDRSGIAKRIDYQQDPVVQLSEVGRRYLAELRESGSLPPLSVEHRTVPHHEYIAVAAYFLWVQAGRPHGHDQEHWLRAIDLLIGRKT